MEMRGLDMRLTELWQAAADDLGVRVSAPMELHDRTGSSFYCEAFLPDFGSRTGAYVLSRKTERRVRHHLVNLEEELWKCTWEERPSYRYARKHFIDTLLDFRWFGVPGSEPTWYLERSPRSR